MTVVIEMIKITTKEGEIMEKKILDCIHQFIDQKAFDKCTCIEISQQLKQSQKLCFYLM